MLYWPGRLLIKIIVLVDFKGCQIFLITPSFICISMRNLFLESLRVVVDAKEVKRVIIVPAEEEAINAAKAAAFLKEDEEA